VLYAEKPKDFIIFFDGKKKKKNVMDRITVQKFLVAYYSLLQEDEDEIVELKLFDVGSSNDCKEAFKKFQDRREKRSNEAYKQIICVDFALPTVVKSWIVKSIDVDVSTDENNQKSVTITLKPLQAEVKDTAVVLYKVSYTIDDLLRKYGGRQASVHKVISI
jgi:hypothetical protein